MNKNNKKFVIVFNYIIGVLFFIIGIMYTIENNLIKGTFYITLGVIFSFTELIQYMKNKNNKND